ncbi:sigma factor-like helix-turn-helix DNA-binding protein [Bacillus safensis]
MHTVQNMSFEEIAQLLNIKKGTVQKNIERSRLKIKKKRTQPILFNLNRFYIIVFAITTASL